MWAQATRGEVRVHSEGEGEGSLLRVDKDAALAYQVGQRPT